ncbi:MAG: hypothetical protein J3Q66DRAFT_370651 [Benniella sp.]|nr:MAG: hypothetical protein J3Q66DRAFT_370651 [Benniella sp.]
MDSGIEICSKVIHEGDVLNIEFLDHDKTLLVTIGKPSKEQSGVLIPGGSMIGCKDDCAAKEHQELNKHTYQHPGSQLQYQLVVDFEDREAGNRQYKAAHVCLYSVDGRGQKQDIITIMPEPWRLFDMNEENTRVCTSFVEYWPQFIITTPLGFQVWNLPDISPYNRCEMVLSWVQPCLEGATSNGELSGYAEMIQDISVCVHGECYINHDPPEDTIDDNVMTKIARSAKWNCCCDILNPILRSTDGKWIPRCSSIGTERSTTNGPVNPIMFLVKDAKQFPQSLSMAEQMMDYCIRQAKSQCDPNFILPIMSCLRMLADHHPETAIDITRRTAFIPVRNQDFLVNRSILARPIWRPMWDKIMRRSGATYEYPDPVFQLKSQLPKIRAKDISTHIEVPKEVVVDPMNKTFKGQVYMAPYSLLWHYTNDEVMNRSSMGVSTEPDYDCYLDM